MQAPDWGLILAGVISPKGPSYAARVRPLLLIRAQWCLHLSKDPRESGSRCTSWWGFERSSRGADSKTRLQRAAAAAAAAHTFPTEKYERRIQLLQATCVGWSPFTAAREGAAAISGQMCMVAVGTRAGRVWLWRYTPPPPTLFPAEDEESKRLELVSGAVLLALSRKQSSEGPKSTRRKSMSSEPGGSCRWAACRPAPAGWSA